jgi:hypothetical protein
MAFDVSLGKWFFNPGKVESFKQTCAPNRFVSGGVCHVSALNRKIMGPVRFRGPLCSIVLPMQSVLTSEIHKWTMKALGQSDNLS